MIGSITGRITIERSKLDRLFGESYGLEDLTAMPSLMLMAAAVWFLVGGLFGLIMPIGQFLEIGEKWYYISLTAHGAAIVFPFVFQFMMGMSLLRAGGCLGKSSSGRFSALSFVFLNVGALLFALSLLLGVRWSYVFMFPLPMEGVELGMWTHNEMVLGFTGVLLILLAVIVFYPLQLGKMLFFGDKEETILLEPREITDPGMIAMSLALLMLVLSGIPILITSTAIGLGLYGIVPMDMISWFTEPVVFQYFFWIFAHNLMEVMGLMAIGATYAILPLYTADGSQEIYSRRLAIAALLILAIAAATGFFHHLYTTFPAQPAALSFHGNLVSWAIGIGAALSLFTVLGTIWEHGIKPEPGLLFILGGFGLYMLDGTAALLISNVRFNFQLHGTMWASGHAMTIILSLLLIWIGAFYHYYPVLTNRKLDRGLGLKHFLLTIVSAVAMYYTFMYAGADGVVRRMYLWAGDGWLLYAVPLLLFGTMFFIGQVLFAYNIYGSRNIDLTPAEETAEAD